MLFLLIIIGIIQLWRRVTDSSLIDECTDDVVIDNTTARGSTGICFERARSRKSYPIYLHNDNARKQSTLRLCHALFSLHSS